MQRLQDTDAFILMEFSVAAKALKARNLPNMEKVEAIKEMVRPFLKRLEDNGVSQRDRMLMLLRAYNEA